MGARGKITNLARHDCEYVTVAQLAAYWQVSRKQIYKHIEAGTLEALKLGPRLYRIRAGAALDFERQAQMRPSKDQIGPEADSS